MFKSRTTIESCCPAQKSTSFSEVDFAISNIFFGSGIRHHGQGDEAASSTVVYSINPLGHTILTYPLQGNIHLHGLSLDDWSERHHYISLASHQMRHHPDSLKDRFGCQNQTIDHRIAPKVAVEWFGSGRLCRPSRRVVAACRVLFVATLASRLFLFHPALLFASAFF